MRFIHPIILFLDEDLQKSAQFLTNRFLSLNIKNCCQVLVCSLLYNVGIRSKRFCDYYFCNDRKEESIRKFFPTWPLKKPPSFVSYNSQEAKWCRKCQNHFEVILNYFEFLLDEYGFRYGHDHELYDMLYFMKIAPMDCSIRTGVRLVYVQNLKIVLPWKNLPIRFRKRDIIEGYRNYYCTQIVDPMLDYENSKRDIPDFILKNRILAV
jgi:hypothetical protein